MPKEFTHTVGPRRITHFIPMEEVLDEIRDNNLLDTNIDKICEEAGFYTPYLVYTVDRRITIAEVGNFVTPYGKQFGASYPSNINGSIYHAKGVMPRDTIRGVVNLETWRDGRNE